MKWKYKFMCFIENLCVSLGTGIKRIIRMNEKAWLSTIFIIRFSAVCQETFTTFYMTLCTFAQRDTCNVAKKPPVYSVPGIRDETHNKNDWKSFIINYFQYKISHSRPRNLLYILFLGTRIKRTVRITEKAWLPTAFILKFPSVGPEASWYWEPTNRDETHNESDWKSLIINYLHYEISLSRPRNLLYILFLGTRIKRRI
jgi:hypothetical protein